MNANTNYTAEQYAALTPNDRKEVQKFRRYLKLKKTRWGRNMIKTQKYWQEYENGQK